MKTFLFKFPAFCLLLVFCAVMSGCSAPGPSEAELKASAATLPAPAAGKKPAKGGGVSDVTADPAPPGVKTGVEGGKKN